MNRYFVTALLSIGLLLLTASASGLDVPLKFEQYADRGRSLRPYGSSAPEKMIDRPAGDWKFPEFNSKFPVYAFAKLGEQDRLLVLDRTKQSDFFYNRIHFDANGNRDLTDDPVVDGKATRYGNNNEYCMVVFSDVDTTVEVDGKTLPYSFRPALTGMDLHSLGEKQITIDNINRYMYLSLNANCCYSGEFELDGRSYRIMLGDANCSGRFDDKMSVRTDIAFADRRPVYVQGDQFYISAGPKIMGLYDAQTLGDWLLVGDKSFAVRVNTAEGKMTLVPRSEGLNALTLTAAAERLSLYTEDGNRCMMVYQPGETIMVPPGKYRMLTYQLLRKDLQGDLWQLVAGGTKKSPFVTVDGSGEAVLKFGEPYVPIAEVPERYMDNVRNGSSSHVQFSFNQVQLSFNVEGAGKELLTDLRRLSGNRTRIKLSKKSPGRPEEPTYMIWKTDGEIAARGSFEYG